jgi:hypothetical protein
VPVSGTVRLKGIGDKSTEMPDGIKLNITMVTARMATRRQLLKALDQ